MGKLHQGRPYRRLVAQVRALHMPCALCGHPIDYTLPARHPMSYTLEHALPVSKGGSVLDPVNARAAHRRCNSAKGNRPAKPRGHTSRPW